MSEKLWQDSFHMVYFVFVDDNDLVQIEDKDNYNHNDLI